MSRQKKDIEILEVFQLYKEPKNTGCSFLRNKRGCYIIYLNEINKKSCLYIGMASTDLEDVITRHFQKGNRTQVKFKQHTDDNNINYFCRVYLCRNVGTASKLERYLIGKLRPFENTLFNVDAKDLSKYKRRKRIELEAEIERKLISAGAKKEVFQYSDEVPF